MSDTLLVSTRKGLFWIVRKATGWAIDRVDFLGDAVTLTLTDPRDGRHYAALEHGHFGVKLHRSTTAGTWEEIAAPAYPPKPEGLDERDPWGRPINWTTARIWALEAGPASEPGLLWAGTQPGGLFLSRDHGATWEINAPLWHHPRRVEWMGGGADLPGIHSICVDPQEPAKLWVAVSTGGIWHTADHGATWRNIGEGMRAEHWPPEKMHEPIAQDVHCLVQCPAAPHRFCVQHHNGIFISSDAAENFTEITTAQPSAFGFPVAVHPTNPDTAWFVPGIKDEKRVPCDARLVVTRTRDGGKTFDILSRGLPQQHAYDVVYRHALALSADANRLAIGSTTGGLWISEDQGEGWSCISHTLPPIYAVRFA